MTEEKILEIVKFHFQEGGVRDDGSCSEYYGTTQDFIDFALTLYELGVENGWEQHIESEYLNSSYPTGLVGDPQ